MVLHDPSLAAPLRLIWAGLNLHRPPFAPPPYSVESADSATRPQTACFTTSKGSGGWPVSFSALNCHAPCTGNPQTQHFVCTNVSCLTLCLTTNILAIMNLDMEDARQHACCLPVCVQGRSVREGKMHICGGIEGCNAAGSIELLAARSLALMRSLTEFEQKPFLDQAFEAPATKELARHTATRAAHFAGQLFLPSCPSVPHE